MAIYAFFAQHFSSEFSFENRFNRLKQVTEKNIEIYSEIAVTNATILFTFSIFSQ